VGKAIYCHPVRSSTGTSHKAGGLRWLSLMLLAPVPWAGCVRALPLLTALAPSERCCQERGQRHKKLTGPGGTPCCEPVAGPPDRVWWWWSATMPSLPWKFLAASSRPKIFIAYGHVEDSLSSRSQNLVGMCLTAAL
jgi:hypothetical protein